MKFVILGAGAMGCLYGAKLKAAGQEVVFIANSEGNVAALNQGLVVRDFYPDGDRDASFCIPAYKSADYNEPCDAVLAWTKAADSEKAWSSLGSKVIGENTVLISLQNGIGHEEILRRYADEDRIVIGTTNFPSDRIRYGEIRQCGTGVSKMFTLSGAETERFREIAEIFDKAGLNPVKAPDIRSAIWEKAAFNAAINSVTAVTLIPQGYLTEFAEGYELLHSVADEVCSVAKAKGLTVDADRVKATIDGLLKDHFNHMPSMLQDVLNRRMTEIDFINGAAVREAKAIGISVPTTEVLYKLIRITQSTYEHRLLK